MISVLAGLCASLPAAAQTTLHSPDPQNYFALVLRSGHFGAKTQEAEDLNDNTPGITVGRRYPTATPGVEKFVEGGIFYNSYKEVSPVLFGGYSTSLFNIAKTEVRIGVFAGVGYYRQLGKDLHANYGLPYLKGFIPIAGLTASFRMDDHELRLTTVPADNLDTILNLSYAVQF